MALIRTDAMFKIFPAKAVYKQRVKLRPNEHHYENEGEKPYIKYSCQICEAIANKCKDIESILDEEDRKFMRFSFPEGTEQCPCCGINIDWDYKRS